MSDQGAEEIKSTFVEGKASKWKVPGILDDFSKGVVDSRARESMKKWILRGLVGAVLLLALIGLKVWVFAPEPISITVVSVESGLVQETVTNSRAGTIKARFRAHLSPEIGGRVVAVPYRKGMHVKAGDVLLRLHDAPQRAAQALAERELIMAKARRDRSCLEANRAKRVYERNVPLLKKNFVSADLLDDLQSKAQTSAALCKEAQAEIDRGRAALEQSKAELEKTVLRAPFDGIVADVDIEVGEWTTPAPVAISVPPVLDIINPSSIYVRAPMDEVDSAKIKPGQKVLITLDPYPGRQYPGRVAQVGAFVEDIEAQNRTVDIDVEFEDKTFASTLLPGTSADVEVILTQQENVLRIPTSTLLEGERVFLVDQGTIVERSVTTGLKNWDFVEITHGLAEGDEIISSLDRQGLEAGAPVEIVEGDSLL